MSTSLLFLILLAIASTICSWSPAVAPRFDLFSEKLVGSWYSSGDEETRRIVVHDVMRRCGGAVQGIDDDERYLNRADDGFCYYDCGSYSYGPVVWSDDSLPLLVASLSLTPTTRVLFSANASENFPSCNRILHLSKRPLASKEQETALEVFTHRPEYQVTQELQCCMPSQSQPWMMQRLQWKQQEEALTADNQASPSGFLHVWVYSKADEVSFGVACRSTGFVKEIRRIYNDNHQLVEVQLRHGRSDDTSFQ